MAHSEWCGNLCGDCEEPCKLDWTICCSPDCEYLDPKTDSPMGEEECKDCDAYEDWCNMQGLELKRHP